MTRDRDFKRIVRERAKRIGVSYSEALRQVRAQTDEDFDAPPDRNVINIIDVDPGVCDVCGQQAAVATPRLCTDCGDARRTLTDAAHSSGPPLGVAAVMSALDGVGNPATVLCIDAFDSWFSMTAIEQLVRRPNLAANPGAGMKLGFMPSNPTLNLPDRTARRAVPFGGSGGAKRMTFRFGCTPTLAVGTDAFTVTGGGGNAVVTASAANLLWQATTPLDVTVYDHAPRPPGSCQLCANPQGTSGPFCGDCRDVMFSVLPSFEVASALPTGCLPLALHADTVLGDVTFLAIIDWGGAWTLRCRFDPQPGATYVPLHGRWTATDDQGGVYRGCSNAGYGGAPGGWFGDTVFAPALSPNATALTLTLHHRGDVPLLEATVPFE